MTQIQQQRSGTIIFIDENLADKKIGLLSIPWPPAPQQIISRIREKFGMYDEMKWSAVSKHKVPFLTEVVEAFFMNTSFGRINVSTITTTVDDAIFQTLNSIRRHCAPYHGIFMDDHTTPKGYDFERRIKNTFNCHCVLRLDSKATQLLQLCDLMLNLVIKAAAIQPPASPHKAVLVDIFKAARARSEFERCFQV